MLPHFLPYPGVHACKEHIHLVCNYFTSMHRDLFITRVEILQPYMVTIFSQICLFVTSEQPAQNALGLLVRLHQCDRYLTPFKVAAYNLSLKRVKNRVSNGYLSKLLLGNNTFGVRFLSKNPHTFIKCLSYPQIVFF